MMIEVNLLPQEMRRVEHTPLPRFLVIITGTALTAVVLASASVIHFRKIADLKLDLSQKNAQIAQLGPVVARHDALQAGLEDVKLRRNAIAEIWRGRIVWSEKLTMLSQMLPNWIGLEDIKLETARRTGKEENGGYLTLSSICAGGDLERLSNVRRILEGTYPVGDSFEMGKKFFADFQVIERTPAMLEKVEDTVEGEALSFDLKLTLKTEQARLQEYMAANAPKEAPRKRTSRGTSEASSTAATSGRTGQ